MRGARGPPGSAGHGTKPNHGTHGHGPAKPQKEAVSKKVFYIQAKSYPFFYLFFKWNWMVLFVIWFSVLIEFRGEVNYNFGDLSYKRSDLILPTL